jgi:hypothetical protein
VYKNQKNITVSFKKLYIYEFSYISIYIAYLLITPFVEIFGQYHSVYGKFTNFNSNYIIDGIAGS